MLQPQLQAAALDENDDDDGDGMEAAGHGVEKPRLRLVILLSRTKLLFEIRLSRHP